LSRALPTSSYGACLKDIGRRPSLPYRLADPKGVIFTRESTLVRELGLLRPTARTHGCTGESPNVLLITRDGARWAPQGCRSRSAPTAQAAARCATPQFSGGQDSWPSGSRQETLRSLYGCGLLTSQPLYGYLRLEIQPANYHPAARLDRTE